MYETLKQSSNDVEKNLKGLDVQILKLLITRFLLLVVSMVFALLPNSHHFHNNQNKPKLTVWGMIMLKLKEWSQNDADGVLFLL